MSNIAGIDKIYVLHHVPFTDRARIFTRLNEEQVEYELVTCHSPEEIGDKYEFYLQDWEKHADVMVENQMQTYRNFSRKVSIGSLSLILKHLYCYTLQVHNEYQNIVIIEDDCRIPVGFHSYLQRNVDDYLELQKTVPVEICMIGTSHGMVSKASENNGKCVFFHVIQKTRCTHAYILSLSGAKKLLDNFHPINNPIDFKINEIMQVTGMKVAWSEPALQQNDGK